jgi:hypothetical protein
MGAILWKHLRARLKSLFLILESKILMILFQFPGVFEVAKVQKLDKKNAKQTHPIPILSLGVFTHPKTNI